MTVAAEYRHHNRTNRASFDPRDQIVAGDAGNNAVAEPNHRWGDPDTRDVMTFVNASVPLNARQTRFLYAFGGFSRREANSAGFYRRALDARNWPQIYPLGFLPVIEPTVVDASATAGVRGVVQRMDLRRQRRVRAQQLRLHDRRHAERVARADACRPTRPSSTPARCELNQFVGNVDVSRAVRRRALRRPAQRRVRRGVPPRELPDHAPASRTRTATAASPNQSGGRAAIGAQVFPGFRPSNEVDESRNSVAGYVDVEGDVLDVAALGVAGRDEHYSDFGSTVDGKLTGRVAAATRASSSAARSAPASARRRSASRSSRRRPRTS